MISGLDAGEGDRVSPGGGAWGRRARSAGEVVAVLCSLGALVFTGPVGWVALLALVLMGVVVVRATAPDRTANVRCDGQRAMSSGRPPTPVVGPLRHEDQPPAPVVELSDDELCWWWRHSATQLERVSGPAALARVAEQRRSYLDELERRHPARFAAWMGSGVRAASNPTPFFRPAPPP